MRSWADIRADFPMLERRIDHSRLVYLDSAATSLKPKAVIEAVREHHQSGTANIHRGRHRLSEEASQAYEDARADVGRFLGAPASQVVFVRNATEALGLAAHLLGAGPKRRVLVPRSEHHSNVLPWLSADALTWVEVDAQGLLSPQALEAAVEQDAVAVAFAVASNVTGAVQPVNALVEVARRKGLMVVLDAAQAAAHLPLSFGELGCDFLAVSAHKLLGPSGVGALVAKEELLAKAEPPLLGGGTIRSVTSVGYELKDAPFRFEAGTPNIEGAIGFGAAVRYLEGVGMERVRAQGQAHAQRLLDGLSRLPKVRVLGPSTAEQRIALASCVFDSPSADPDALAMALSDAHGICVRSGTHCAQPYFRHLGLPGALRASAYLYNTEEDLDLFVERLRALLSATD